MTNRLVLDLYLGDMTLKEVIKAIVSIKILPFYDAFVIKPFLPQGEHIDVRKPDGGK
jgi:hypothetical protein